MEKKTDLWSVQELERRFAEINFPEYQREPNIWSRAAKQRLIDSMIRHFDIASIYLYVDIDRSIDCVDGRQRIMAIMSFLGRNQADDDNDFEFRLLNEIYEDEKHPFAGLQGKSFSEIKEEAKSDPSARRFVEEFQAYGITIVELSGSSRSAEFNLQFTRLNLGTIINSGEKLHAMVGDLRDACFEKGGLGLHPFLQMIGIPTRRYAREQVAAQILAQVFSIERSGEFTRTRHFDLQRLFKQYGTLTDNVTRWIDETRAVMDLLEAAFDDPSILRNRAVTVSTVLLAHQLEIGNGDKGDASQLARFMDGFLCRLRWQVGKGLDVDNEYRYLIDFQRQVTQASVEKPAVEARATMLESQYQRWLKSGALEGDDVYAESTGHDPAKVCREDRT